jgi:hypothetical protein
MAKEYRVSLVLNDEARDALQFLRERAARAASAAGRGVEAQSTNALICALIIDAAHVEADGAS